MKQKGNCLIGDPIRLDRYTSDWECIRLNPSVFYRRLNEFQKSFKKVKGFYAEIDMGQFICVRFSDKQDLTEFCRIHHEYV